MSTTKKKYDVTPDGLITRQEPAETGPVVPIADLVGDRVTWRAPEYHVYLMPVRTLLKQRGIEARIVEPEPAEPVVAGDGVTVTTSVPPQEVRVQQGVDADGPDGLRGLTIEQRKAINYLRSKEGFELGTLERPVPPEPRKTSGAGDKTPAFVTWLLRYHPKRFAELYGVIGMGSIEVVKTVIDPETKKKKRIRSQEAGHVIARRETIYTKVNRNNANLEDDSE